MDAIVYGCLISLGFATYENYEYVYLIEFEISNLSVAIIRALSAIPLHACCGIIMGYYFIFFHFRQKKIYLICCQINGPPYEVVHFYNLYSLIIDLFCCLNSSKKTLRQFTCLLFLSIKICHNTYKGTSVYRTKCNTLRFHSS